MKEFAKAMAKAQTEIKSAMKETKGQIGQNKAYKYADLSSIWDACKAALSANAIAVIQKPDFDAAGMWLETILLHASGESVTGRYPILPTQNSPQAYGSAITYARRYSLSAMIGIVTDDDDDGKAASQTREMPEPERAPDQTPAEKQKAGLEAAKSFVNTFVQTLNLANTASDIDAVYGAHASKIARLKEAYADQYAYINAAITDARERVTKVEL